MISINKHWCCGLTLTLTVAPQIHAGLSSAKVSYLLDPSDGRPAPAFPLESEAAYETVLQALKEPPAVARPQVGKVLARAQELIALLQVGGLRVAGRVFPNLD